MQELRHDDAKLDDFQYELVTDEEEEIADDSEWIDSEEDEDPVYDRSKDGSDVEKEFLELSNQDDLLPQEVISKGSIEVSQEMLDANEEGFRTQLQEEQKLLSRSSKVTSSNVSSAQSPSMTRSPSFMQPDATMNLKTLKGSDKDPKSPSARPDIKREVAFGAGSRSQRTSKILPKPLAKQTSDNILVAQKKNKKFSSRRKSVMPIATKFSTKSISPRVEIQGSQETPTRSKSRLISNFPSPSSSDISRPPSETPLRAAIQEAQALGPWQGRRGSGPKLDTGKSIDEAAQSFERKPTVSKSLVPTEQARKSMPNRGLTVIKEKSKNEKTPETVEKAEEEKDSVDIDLLPFRQRARTDYKKPTQTALSLTRASLIKSTQPPSKRYSVKQSTEQRSQPYVNLEVARSLSPQGPNQNSTISVQRNSPLLQDSPSPSTNKTQSSTISDKNQKKAKWNLHSSSTNRIKPSATLKERELNPRQVSKSSLSRRQTAKPSKILQKEKTDEDINSLSIPQTQLPPIAQTEANNQAAVRQVAELFAQSNLQPVKSLKKFNIHKEFQLKVKEKKTLSQSPRKIAPLQIEESKTFDNQAMLSILESTSPSSTSSIRSRTSKGWNFRSKRQPTRAPPQLQIPNRYISADTRPLTLQTVRSEPKFSKIEDLGAYRRNMTKLKRLEDLGETDKVALSSSELTRGWTIQSPDTIMSDK